MIILNIMYAMMYTLLQICVVWFFFFKQKPAYEMSISDWSSDVCSSDLWFVVGEQDTDRHAAPVLAVPAAFRSRWAETRQPPPGSGPARSVPPRSEQRRVGTECVRY